MEIRSRDTRKARSNRRIRLHRAFCSIARARIYFIKLIEHGVQSRIRIFRARISDISRARGEGERALFTIFPFGPEKNVDIQVAIRIRLSLYAVFTRI